MSAFGRALTRELRHLRRDRWDLAALFVIPAILLALMAGMLWQGTMHKLPLAVVDSDRTTASRTMIRALDASPMIRIEGSYPSEVDAMRALRSGEAMALVHLPPGLGEGLARDREPVVRVLYNASFLSTDARYRALQKVPCRRPRSRSLPESFRTTACRPRGPTGW